jgi:hypothetical protein
MSSFEHVPVELLTHLLQYAGEEAQVRLASTNQQVAVSVAECIVAGAPTWRVAYSVYLCARYATGRRVYGIVSRFRFLPMLSRACRCCGGRTQRRVAGVLLCCRCTRNCRTPCWMLSLSVAHELGIHYIYHHYGARTPLVFADHLQALTGMSRRQLVMYVGLTYRYAVT